MDEDALLESRYENGDVAKNIEHLLMMTAHSKTTVEEIEQMKHDIHAIIYGCFMKVKAKSKET